MKNYDIIVTAASGVESVTKKELFRLGYGDIPAVNGALTLSGGDLDIARLNMFLRTADRVYIRLAAFNAESFDGFFDSVYNVHWEDYLPADARITVNGKSVKSRLFALSALQSLTKKAIIKRLSEAYKTSVFSEDGAEYKIEFHIFKDFAEIMINTSGTGLHKRGYRDLVGVAPIRETLASAMLLLSDFYYKRPLIDPFCGSGTIVIEAARIALDIAPGILRKFDFNDWAFFDKTAYDRAYEEARDKEKPDRELQFSGSDVDGRAVALARRHAAKAGLENKISFEVADVKDFSTQLRNGVIVTNPPYGERLLEKREAEALYRTLGTIYRGLDNWSLFLITNDDGFERAFGKKADKNRKLYNSNKECRFYEYFSKRESKND